MQNLPVNVFTVSQIRQLERMAIEDLGVSGYTLMSRAGEAVVACVQQKFPQAQRFVVLCGIGNNAGDGFVVARLLQHFAVSIHVYVLQETDNFKGDALTAYQNYLDSGGHIQIYDGCAISECDVIIDAMLGTGLSRAVTGSYLAVIAQINDAKVPVIAVDVPSGIHADTGKALPIAVKANFTVTFIGLKLGLCTGDAAEYRGEVVLDCLALPESLFQRVPAWVKRVAYYPMLKRHRCAHKGMNGHVLVIGGDYGFSGAVMLAGVAALRVGSGLVSVATRADHAAMLNLHRPELMCHAIANAGQLQTLLQKVSVVVIGPGLGQSVWAKELLSAVLSGDKPLVIDADGLNLLATMNITKANKSSWILTPHPGEAARLLNCITVQIEQDRLAALQVLQQKFDANIVLKGAGTLIADNEGIAVVTQGNPGMAGGGMGDVLSGVIAGLLAQGMTISSAIRQGVCIHAIAADQAAVDAGERGLLASDLMPYLQKLVNGC